MITRLLFSQEKPKLFMLCVTVTKILETFQMILGLLGSPSKFPWGMPGCRKETH